VPRASNLGPAGVPQCLNGSYVIHEGAGGVIHEGAGGVIHEGAGGVKGRFKVVAVFGGVDVGHGRISRWVKAFRGFAPEFVVVLPGEAGRVKRLGGGQGVIGAG
jgi:hypothetical protein